MKNMQNTQLNFGSRINTKDLRWRFPSIKENAIKIDDGKKYILDPLHFNNLVNMYGQVKEKRSLLEYIIGKPVKTAVLGCKADSIQDYLKLQNPMNLINHLLETGKDVLTKSEPVEKIFKAEGNNFDITGELNVGSRLSSYFEPFKKPLKKTSDAIGGVLNEIGFKLQLEYMGLSKKLKG
jgi:hypothetical protein